MELFLTRVQLRELTGLTQGAAQVRWLRKHGITHYVRADGRPQVLHSALVPPAQPARSGSDAPRFDALRKVV